MDRKEELRQWISISKEDLDVAKFLAEKYHPKPVEKICNFCQQSAEKDLKGYLFNMNISTTCSYRTFHRLFQKRYRLSSAQYGKLAKTEEIS